MMQTGTSAHLRISTHYLQGCKIKWAPKALRIFTVVNNWWRKIYSVKQKHFKTQLGLVEKREYGGEWNPRPRKSSLVLCQMTYERHCLVSTLNFNLQVQLIWQSSTFCNSWYQESLVQLFNFVSPDRNEWEFSGAKAPEDCSRYELYFLFPSSV